MKNKCNIIGEIQRLRSEAETEGLSEERKAYLQGAIESLQWAQT